MRKFLWLLTALGSLVGAFFLIASIFMDMSAPQQAAAAGVAVGCAVIPYCLARAVQELSY
jgi:hypothetical protein